jgi:hypothetical protein
MSAPGIVIVFPLEGVPVVSVDVMHESEQQRLLDWINDGRPEYAELVFRALALAKAERAA